MAYLCLKCPHCHTDSVFFYSVADSVINVYTFETLFICNFCKKGVIARILVARNQHGNPLTNSTPHALNADISKSKAFSIEKIFPSAEKIAAPQHTPDHISRYYLQGLDNLNRKNFDAAGVMFRKTLDVTTKHLGETDGSLYERVERLEQNKKITPAMKEWAHAIRLDGNDAAHDDDPFDEENCDVLKSFTEVFLMYCFTLPQMLEERRAKKPT